MKASDRKRKIGGFVGFNNGNIEDSYSVLSLSDKKSITGGFVGKNQGTIHSSYSCKSKKTLLGGFVGEEGGKSSDCVFIHNLSEKDVSKFSDSNRGISKQDFVLESDILEQTNGVSPVRFIEKKWIYYIPEADIHDRECIIITSADDLITFCDRVNRGETEAQQAYVLLKKDIDLKGKNWTPIGNSETNAFYGIFNGNCHCIKNFKMIKSDTLQGLFGILYGEVYNLTVDCQLGSAKSVGGLVAENRGIIGCSAAIVSVKGKKQSEYVGGFVGVNYGKIFQCYSAGKMSFAATPLWIGIAAIFLIGIVIVLLSTTNWNPVGNHSSVFKPIPIDSRQEILEDSIPASDNSSTAKNRISFGVNSTIILNLSKNECIIGLENPSKSNKKVTSKLIMENTDGTEFTIAETNAIEPGHKISKISIDESVLEKLSVGKYNAKVYMYFYNDDNSLSMVNSAIDVTLEVIK